MWKYGFAIAVPVVSFIAGYHLASKQIVEKRVEVVGETRTEYKDRIITKIVEVKPDGTRTETIKEEDRKGSSETASNSTSRQRENARATSRDHRVGASYWIGSPTDLLGREAAGDLVSFSGSRRILGPVWLEAQARPFGSKKEIALGIAWEF